MTDQIILGDCTYYEDAFQDKGSPFHKLFEYTMALQGKLCSQLCNCNWTNQDQNPSNHDEDCKFRLVVTELQNE